MSMIGVGIGAVAIGGTVASGVMQAGAASDAAAAQVQAGDRAVEESRRQFNAAKAILKPYVDAGVLAIGGQKALLGLSGNTEQQKAISAIENSPQMRSLLQQGENAMRQNASATGGLRGGNFQAALAQFRPRLLTQLLESQYGKLAGMTGVGQASAAGQAAMGLQTGSQIADIFTQQGQAIAGKEIAQGQAYSGMAKGVAQTLMTGMMGGF